MDVIEITCHRLPVLVFQVANDVARERKTPFGGNYAVLCLWKMSTTNVKSLLLLSSTALSSSYSILFHCARYWAQQGSRILFISKTPLKNLPLAVGKGNGHPNPDVFKLIQFMYLANWEELLTQLYSIHLRHDPVSVIIVKNLENYFQNEPELHSHEDHVSLVCASLLYAASACAKVLSQPIYLVNEYVCGDLSIEKAVIKNFFHNIWELKRTKDEKERIVIKLTKLFVTVNDEISSYTLHENLAESRLSFDEVIKSIINLF